MFVAGAGAVSAASLTLGTDDTLSLDYADASTIPSLSNGSIQLRGGTLLELSNCGSSDGKTYTLAAESACRNRCGGQPPHG